ncbi:polysaccharide biosynthesis C-terminal domain-containing protein [Cytobacillus oceanisediminis]|uniref:polysaccharide biosynthesis C-terminal domain-containing protein n=1 Tax=Cytobacillus oceanisediminis TaxID=665099 RepID=UPI00205C095D|nr:polysaccharide biosynthesis C-terminal domain-containing protein [Cytobacillus oceanisediminis]
MLILGIYPVTLVGFSANYFNSTNKQKSYITIQMIALIINIFLSIILLKINYNIISIAIGTSISYLIYSILMNIYFWISIKYKN